MTVRVASIRKMPGWHSGHVNHLLYEGAGFDSQCGSHYLPSWNVVRLTNEAYVTSTNICFIYEANEATFNTLCFIHKANATTVCFILLHIWSKVNMVCFTLLNIWSKFLHILSKDTLRTWTSVSKYVTSTNICFIYEANEATFNTLCFIHKANATTVCFILLHIWSKVRENRRKELAAEAVRST